MNASLKKLRALRELGLQYIEYNNDKEMFIAYETMNIEDKDVWHVELKRSNELKEIIPTMNEPYEIEKLIKYINTKMNIEDSTHNKEGWI